MENKEMFSNTINNQTGLTECEKFGMTWGCAEECPALQGGNCELYKNVEDFYDKTEGE